MITTLFSGIDYPIVNLYFQGVSQIELLLLEKMESQDLFISNMAEQMKGNFDKYWDCYSVVLACAIVFNSRYKLDYVDYILKKIELLEHIAKMKVENIEITLYKLFFQNMNAPSLWPLQMFHLVLGVLVILMVLWMILMMMKIRKMM